MSKSASPKKRRAALCVLAAAALVIALLVWGARRTPAMEKYSVTWWDVFDTVTVVTGYASSEAEWNEQMEALHADLLHYHQLYDIYTEYDGVTNMAAVNARAAGEAVPVGSEIMDLLRFGKEMYQTTGGACNVAAGAVLRYWHDAREAAGNQGEASADVLPDEADLRAAAAHCDPGDLILDEQAGTVRFADPELRLDVGSMGKGYAVEQCALGAEARGLTSALLNVGGNVRAIGTKPDGSCWTAGVDNPWPGQDDQYATASYVQAVELQPGQSLVISGDDQRYFTVDGVRYHHLIDLTTRQPARYMSSVAVLCSSSAEGDALSTGLFCLPVEQGQALVERLDGVEALWMLPDETLTASSGWTGE